MANMYVKLDDQDPESSNGPPTSSGIRQLVHTVSDPAHGVLLRSQAGSASELVSPGSANLSKRVLSPAMSAISGADVEKALLLSPDEPSSSGAGGEDDASQGGGGSRRRQARHSIGGSMTGQSHASWLWHNSTAQIIQARRLQVCCTAAQ